MKKNLISISMLVLLVMGNLAAKAQTPETLVANLYTNWDGNTTHKYMENRPSMLQSLPRLQKFFSPALAKKIYKVANTDNGIDVDILYDAQDTKIKNFSVGKFQSKDANTGFLNVAFTNFNEKKTIKFFLEKITTGWRVSDIQYHSEGQTYTLKSILNTEN